MADSRPGCTNFTLTAVIVLLGAIVGAVIGGLSGFIFGGVLGYVLLRQADLRRRLKSVEEAQRWVKGFPTSEPAAPLPPPLVPPAVPPSSPPPPPPAPPQAGREPVPFEAPSVTEPVAHVAQPPAPPAAPLHEPTAQRADDRHVQAEPSSDSDKTLANTLKTWVTTGNVPVKVGVLVSLVGLGFLIQEANERGFITLTIEMGLIAVALFGLALLAIGWRLRRTHTIYGLSLQGGGIAALYLTTYAAFAVYDVLGALPGGSAVIVITVGAGVLAVVQDARSLAVLGIIGGFLAPVLVYTQPEDHLALFSFYVVLSAAIVGVAWFKVWPELNILGLGFTFGISAVWLADRYSTDDWASTQPLIAVLVLLYMAIPVLFAIREVPNIEDPWTAPLVFGTPFMGFGLQYLVIGHTEYGLAISALLLAIAQGALALIVRRLHQERGQLAAAYTGLALTFLALAVPFALNAHYTSTVWALQGTLLVWFGCRRERVFAINGGLLLQFLAGLSFMVHLDASGFSLYPEDTLPIVNEYFLGAAVLAVAGLVSGWLLYRDRDRTRIDGAAPPLALAWGTVWWILGGLFEIGSQLGTGQLSAALVFVVASFGTATLLSRRLRWPQLDTLGLGILPTMAAVLIISLANQSHPLELYGWAAWPLSLIAHYGFLRLRESEFSQFGAVLHAGAYWLLAALVGVEVHWQVDRFASEVWPPVAAFAAVLLLVAGTLSGRRLLAWPIAAHWRGYLLDCCGPVLAVLVTVVSVTFLVFDADPSPLPYLPVLNPLGLLAGLLVAVALIWKRLSAAFEDHVVVPLLAASWVPALAVVGVVAVTMEAARSIHHWQDVPWEFESLVASTTLQASLSVIWAVIGLAGMVAGVRLSDRRVWLAGASIMAGVVIKLFLVDLSSLTAVSRVVSFLGVGVLLLIVGYLAPVPPATTEETTRETPQE